MATIAQPDAGTMMLGLSVLSGVQWCESLQVHQKHLFEHFKREKQYLDNVSKATVLGYGWSWKAFEPIFKSGTAISKTDVVGHLATLRSKGLTAVTINTYVRTLNPFFRWLQTEGHCATLLKIPRLKEEKKTIEVFNDGQVTRFVSFKAATVAEIRLHGIVCLILDTESAN